MWEFVQAHWQHLAAGGGALAYGIYKLREAGYLKSWNPFGGSASVSIQDDLETLIPMLARAKARQTGSTTAAHLGEAISSTVKELTA